MIRIFAMDISGIREAEIPSLAAKLSPERQEKILASHTLEKQALSLGAGLCLAAALKEEGLAEQEISYAYGENGKPYLPGSDLCFSLSHSHEIALAAVSREEVGADIERIRDFPGKLPARHFSQKEQEYLASLAQSEQKAAFFRLWTMRESFLKAVGKGLTVPLSSFSAETEPQPRIIQNISPLCWRMTERHMAGYAVSICHLEEEVGEIRMIKPEEV